jgi:hypothetical protein
MLALLKALAYLPFLLDLLALAASLLHALLGIAPASNAVLMAERPSGAPAAAVCSLRLDQPHKPAKTATPRGERAPAALSALASGSQRERPPRPALTAQYRAGAVHRSSHARTARADAFARIGEKGRAAIEVTPFPVVATMGRTITLTRARFLHKNELPLAIRFAKLGEIERRVKLATAHLMDASDVSHQARIADEETIDGAITMAMMRIKDASDRAR